MRTPRPAGTQIDMRRRASWRERFEGYRYGVTDARIVDWLNQFEDRHKDVAGRLLDAIEFVSAEQIHAAFRSLLARIPGWNHDPRKRQGRFAFVAFSSSAGESGDSMLHQFRLATRLNANAFNALFVGRSEILKQRFGAEDTVVFLDDFVGTGNQAVTAWQTMFGELTAEVGNVFLLTVGAFRAGSDRVRNETRIELLAHRLLGNRDSLFHEDCRHFSANEKNRLLRYCRIASPDRPRGFGECGLVIVLSHQCPNNSLAILHAASQSWDPLFPRS